MISGDTHLFILEDEGVVFAEGSQSLYGLNTAAALIWCCLEEDGDPMAAARSLADRSDLSVDQAAQHVAALTREWERLGLLNGLELANRPAGRREADDDMMFVGDPEDVPDAATPVVRRVYRLLESEIAVSFGSFEQEAIIDPIMRHLRVPFDGEPNHRIDLVEGAGGHFVLKDNCPIGCCMALENIAPTVVAAMASVAINDTRYFLQIHAAAVSNGQASLMFPAAPTSGKSTLSTGLMHEGFLFRTDEYTILDEDDLRLRAITVPICLKSSAWPVIEPLFPEIAEQAAHHRPDGKTVRYLPPRSGPENTNRAEPVAAIIFPNYSAGGTTKLEPLAKGLALRNLMEQCLAIPEWFDKRKVERLVGWLETTPCFSLTISDLKEATDLISDRWGST